MTHQYVTLEDTVYLGFAANDTSGSGVDGSTPLFDVRLGGAAASAAPVLSGTPDLLTHANYGPGAYEVAVAATALNGFAADNIYLVYVTLTADSQTPAACIGSFRTGPAPADMIQLGSGAQSATDLKDFADAGYDPATNKVQGVVLVDTATTVTGGATSSAQTTAQNDLDTLTGADGATLATSQGNYAPSKAGDEMALTAAALAAVMTTQMTESYAADGTAPTPAQALMLIQQAINEFAINSTTKTVKKLDGSNTAATFTLDDDTSPTSITRAT